MPRKSKSASDAIRVMVEHPATWLTEPGTEGSVALSSRVRLARNLAGLNYPGSADDETLERVVNYTETARNRSALLQQCTFYHAADISDVNRDFLIERHLISPTFLDGDTHKAALIDSDERTSIMVNEEDHLRVQSMCPGLNIRGAYERANRFDDELCANLEIDYDSDFGFLTACPTNVGTGMRASVLMHLPGLALTRDIDTVIERISKIGMVVRGFYGEGSDVLGNLFQVSNQQTLGVSENEILGNIEAITRSMIEEESSARERLISEAGPQIEDKVWRAYGILMYARTLSPDEVMNLLSAVRLGVSMEMITFLDLNAVNEMLLLSQPAHLQLYYNEEMDSDQRDFLRAKMIREKLREYDRRGATTNGKKKK